jgi:hypothetical protein
MGFVITATPTMVAAPQRVAAMAMPTVAKFKAVKLKTKSRPKKVIFNINTWNQEFGVLLRSLL